MREEADAEQLASEAVEHLADLGTPLEHIVEKTGLSEAEVKAVLYGEEEGHG
jgi:hypothetical protein